MKPSVLFISLSSLFRTHPEGAGPALAEACHRSDRPLVTLFPVASLGSVALSGLTSADRFLKTLEESQCRSPEEPSQPADFKSRVLAEVDRCIRILGPALVVIEQAPGLTAEARDLADLIEENHPGIGTLVVAGGGPGALDGLGRRLGSAESGDAAGGLKVWEAAGPILPVWPGAGGAEGLCRQRSFFTDDNTGPANRSRGVLFMSGPGSTPFDLPGLAALLGPWLDEKPAEMGFGLQVPLSPAFDAGGADALFAELREKGLKLVHWILEDAGESLPRALLWQVSKMGVWNHVSGEDLFRDRDPAGPAFWMANNPNIVHSLASQGKKGRTPWAPVLPEKIPDALFSYGTLPPLPGLPFWQVLGDVRSLLSALLHMEAKSLLRLRADLDQQSTLSLGSGLAFHFKKPEELDRQTLDEIVAMVDAGGSVDITHVRANLEKAYLIAYAVENGVIVGNSSLKHPRQVFIDRLHRITGLDFTRFVERGYTSVRPEYRAMGIGARLLEGLTSRATDVKVFSLISEDNLATQKIAIRNNTRKIAVYFSDKVGKEMGVWMPEHMIDSDWEIKL